MPNNELWEERCRKAGSVSKLAALLGVTRQTVHRWKAGTRQIRPQTEEHLKLIDKELGVKVSNG